MTTQPLHPAPEGAGAGAGAQPAFGKEFERAIKAPMRPPFLHPDAVLRPRAPDPFAERALRGAGSLADAEIFACREYPNDVKKQIMVLSDNEFPAGTGLPRAMGYARKGAIRRGMMRLVDGLEECADQCGDPSLRLRNTDEFCERHLLAILGLFARKKTKLSTMHDQLSILRKFMTLLGRRHLVPTTDGLAQLALAHGIDLELGCRSGTAYVPRAWCAILHTKRLLEDIKREDEHAHLLCELCLLFGLRLTEVLRLRAVESDLGYCLWVWRGAKGKRERWVPLSTDPERRAQQRSVLDRAKAACFQDRHRHLGYGDRTLEQARKYFEAILSLCGVTQSQLGVKLHGARHDYAVRRFAELTGLPAPVLRQAPLAAYTSRMALVQQALEQIAAELGHGRPEIVAVYIGSLSTLRHEERKAELAGEIMGQHCAELGKLGVATVTVAIRKIDRLRHTCTLYVQASDGGAVAMQGDSLAARVRKAACAWLGHKVEVLVGPAPAQTGTVSICIKHA